MIEDDGRGFDPATVARPTREGRLGLYGMQERAALLDGEVTIDAQPQRGTTVTVDIPLQVPAPQQLDPVRPAVEVG